MICIVYIKFILVAQWLNGMVYFFSQTLKGFPVDRIFNKTKNIIRSDDRRGAWDWEFMDDIRHI